MDFICLCIWCHNYTGLKYLKKNCKKTEKCQLQVSLGCRYSHYVLLLCKNVSWLFQTTQLSLFLWILTLWYVQWILSVEYCEQSEDAKKKKKLWPWEMNNLNLRDLKISQLQNMPVQMLWSSYLNSMVN